MEGQKGLRVKWRMWMENPKSRKLVYIIMGILGLLLVAALCTGFYFLGASQREDNAQVSTPVKREGKMAKETTKDAIEATEDAAGATEDAVTADAAEVIPEVVQEQESADRNNGSVNGNGSGSSGGQAGSGDTSTAVGNSAAGSSYAGKLAVVGNQLCTANGTPIQLRGVSTHGLSWFPDYVNEQMFAEIKGWGANTVRLAMYTAEYNGYCTGDSANRTKLKNLIKQGVQYATKQNLYVIIDWHILSDGNPNTYKSQAMEFFAEMAESYKDNDHVIYEICNEPNGGANWSSIKSYAVDVIAAIRAHDPDGVILVGTPTWSQEVDKAAADPITGYSNIMYTLHFYADTHRDSLRNTMVGALQKGLPIFVSEFGICDASGNGGLNTAQGDAWIQILNQYGVSYVAWNLSNKAETSALIQSGCSKVNGITQGDLSDSGKWLLKTLQGSAATGSAPVADSGGASSGGSASWQDSGAGANGNNGNDGSNNNANNNNNQNQSNPVPVTKTPEQYAPQCSAGVEYAAVNSWQEGNAFCIQYEIKVANNTGAVMDGWNGALTFPANAAVVSGWNANFSVSGNTVSFSAMDYNKTVQSGGKAEGIGCIIRFE